MKKVAKIILRAIATLLATILLYLVLAVVLSWISTTREEPESDEVTLYILTNGVHTDIVVPVRNTWMDWSTIMPYANTAANNTQLPWLAMGWGDRGFYLQTPTWADLTFNTAFKAATGLSQAAVHATFYRSMREAEDCRKITISHEQYLRLVTYIKNTLKTHPNGQARHIPTDANYNDYDAFYEAHGHYNLFYTCNTWANNALKSCGQKACWWTPFDTGIFYHYPQRNP